MTDQAPQRPTNPLGLDRRVREALDILRREGPYLSLGTAQRLVDLGFDAPTAWALVEKVLAETRPA